MLLRADKRGIKLGLVKLKYESTMDLLRQLVAHTCEVYISLCDYDKTEYKDIEKVYHDCKTIFNKSRLMITDTIYDHFLAFFEECDAFISLLSNTSNTNKQSSEVKKDFKNNLNNINDKNNVAIKSCKDFIDSIIIIK